MGIYEYCRLIFIKNRDYPATLDEQPEYNCKDVLHLLSLVITLK
jgi:hypothetical protein